MDHPFSHLNVKPLPKWIHSLTCKYFQVSSMETKPSLDPTNYCSVSLLPTTAKFPERAVCPHFAPTPQNPAVGLLAP